jgi:hypothetical protein
LDLYADEIGQSNLNSFGAQVPQVRFGYLLCGLFQPIRLHLPQGNLDSLQCHRPESLFWTRWAMTHSM